MVNMALENANPQKTVFINELQPLMNDIENDIVKIDEVCSTPKSVT